MTVTFYEKVPPSSVETAWPGSDHFSTPAAHNLIESNGRSTRIVQTLYTPVKQVSAGGFIRPVGSKGFLFKQAVKSASGKHTVHPSKIPVNGNLMRIVGSAKQEEDGPILKEANPATRMEDGLYNPHSSGGFSTTPLPKSNKLPF